MRAHYKLQLQCLSKVSQLVVLCFRLKLKPGGLHPEGPRDVRLWAPAGTDD